MGFMLGSLFSLSTIRCALRMIEYSISFLPVGNMLIQVLERNSVYFKFLPAEQAARPTSYKPCLCKTLSRMPEYKQC